MSSSWWAHWLEALREPQIPAEDGLANPPSVASAEKPGRSLGKPARTIEEMRAGLAAVHGVAPTTEPGPLLKARAEGWLTVAYPDSLGAIRALRLLRRRGFPARLRDTLVLVRDDEVLLAQEIVAQHAKRLETSVGGQLLLYRGPLLFCVLLSVAGVLLGVTGIVWTFVRHTDALQAFGQPPMFTFITGLAVSALLLGVMLGGYQLFLLPRVQDWLEDRIVRPK